MSRLTPGTNLLALYAVLGHRLGGWPLAVQAVGVGVLVPASLAVVVAALYTRANSPGVAALMSGARAGGVAVFIGAAIRLVRPQVAGRAAVGLTMALALALLAWLTQVSVFVVLLLAGAVGAVVLRPR